ncbi:MAG: hypothetical protein EBU84_20125, partial [Actinobacteria bacterium]|nr:hypothetical protein [Actinomycetota bacterium]
MGTPILFHGPEGRDKAVSWSTETGRPVSEPIGDNGLKVDDSRLIVNLANQGGVGDKPPTLVIGPIDRATVEAADALLKTLEDLAEGPLRIALWADFLIGVSPTIRSRTQDLWCPGTVRFPRSVKQAAENIITASRQGVGVLDAVCSALDGNDPEILLDAVVANMSVEDLALWERLRPMLGAKWVTAKTAFIEPGSP